jgi:serine/threonine protein kinase
LRTEGGLGRRLMSASEHCPDHETLGRWNAATLAHEHFEAVCDHLETCPVCQQRIDQIEDRSFDLCQPLGRITTADLDRARQAMEADSPTVRAVSSWIAELRSQVPQACEPTLQVPCELRQYAVQRLIAHGGMGEVYEASHQSLKRPVALKVMRSHRRDDPVAQDHFFREIRTAGQLDHPNLVRAFDAWEQDGFVFLAQELLDGDSLRWLANHGQIASAAEIVDYLTAICRGVGQLHACGFLHRDINPSNIMRLRDGTIKLIDYGLTVPTDSDAWTRLPRAGTVGFMAPEQASGSGALDERCDIYSVGCVLQYLLRHLPNDLPSEHDAGQREVGPRRELERLAAEMTEAHPGDRPPSIAAVQSRLEQLGQQRTAIVEQSGRWQRNAGNAALLGLYLLSLCLLGLFLLGLCLLAVPTANLRRATPAPEGPSQTALTADTRAEQPQPAFLLKMVDIPAGQFVMGGVTDDPMLRPNEVPQRIVVFDEPSGATRAIRSPTTFP